MNKLLLFLCIMAIGPSAHASWFKKLVPSMLKAGHGQSCTGATICLGNLQCIKTSENHKFCHCPASHVWIQEKNTCVPCRKGDAPRNFGAEGTGWCTDAQTQDIYKP